MHAVIKTIDVLEFNYNLGSQKLLEFEKSYGPSPREGKIIFLYKICHHCKIFVNSLRVIYGLQLRTPYLIYIPLFKI